MTNKTVIVTVFSAASFVSKPIFRHVRPSKKNEAIVSGFRCLV